MTKITQWGTLNLITARMTDCMMNDCTVGDVIPSVGNLKEEKSRVFKEISGMATLFPVQWWRNIYVIIWGWCGLRDILNTENVTYWLANFMFQCYLERIVIIFIFIFTFILFYFTECESRELQWEAKMTVKITLNSIYLAYSQRKPLTLKYYLHE
jgi:hypothetical protein